MAMTATERKRKQRRIEREDLMEVTLLLGRETREALVPEEWDQDNRQAVETAAQAHMDALVDVTL